MPQTPYEFKKEDAVEFARYLRINARPHGDELYFQYCPYCKGGQSKDRETFSINLKTGQFKCLRQSCGAKGNMLVLSKDFDFSLGREVDEYFRPQKVYKQLPQPKEKIVPKPEAIEYLKGRGISKEVIDRYQITVQTKAPNILVFPFFDEKGILQCVKYRKTDFVKGVDAGKEWFERNTKPILFGMMQCEDKTTLVVAEGAIDSLSIATAGVKNAVSVPNGCKSFTFIPYCWDWIREFEEIVIFGDYENGEITLVDDFKRRFDNRIRIVRKEDYKDCKDANEILQKYGVDVVKEAVEKAETPPVVHTRSLADVEDVDLFSITKVPTGIKVLDDMLYGGLPFGGITLVAGVSGKGKSTLASQILLNAAANGYKCFAYSGELPNHMFKSWMTLQAAGPDHIFVGTSQSGKETFGVSKTNRNLISEWYRSRISIYDDSIIEGESEKTYLLNVIEQNIMRDGCNVVLIDNLMTALDLEARAENDKYERQSQFMKRLAGIARKRNVLVILVAHKRKAGQYVGGDDQDEISGTSDIANNSMICLSYDSANDIEEGQRRLKVLKNRLFGKVERKGWVMNFDEKSKRVYMDDNELHADYHWGPEDGFFDADGQGDLVFG